MTPWTTACLITVMTLGLPAVASAASVADLARQDYQKADKELNEVYRSVTTTIGMSEGSKKKLIAAELAWIKYRDAEAAFAAAYTAEGGRLSGESQRYVRLTELTRERTKALWAILNDANGD